EQKQVADLAFSPDNKHLAVASGDATIHLWSVATGKRLSSLKGDRSKTGSLAYSPNGKLLASSDGQAIRLWDTVTNNPMRVIPGKEGFLVFSPDSRILATVGKQIQLWDVASGKKRCEFGGDTRYLAFSPDSSRIATVELAGEAILLWDVASGARVVPTQGHE